MGFPLRLLIHVCIACLVTFGKAQDDLDFSSQDFDLPAEQACGYIVNTANSTGIVPCHTTIWALLTSQRASRLSRGPSTEMSYKCSVQRSNCYQLSQIYK